MEAAGEGAVAQQALVGKDEEALVEKRAPVKQDGGKQPSVEEKEATKGSSSEEPSYKEKKARKGDDEKTAEKAEAGKGDEEKAPASAEKEKEAGKDGDEDKPPASAEEEEAPPKEGDDDKPPVSAEREVARNEGDDDKPPASAAKEEAQMEGDDDKPPGSAEKKKARREDDDDKAANAAPADAVAPANPADLTLDTLVADIFSRLPSKAAARFALVSKGCEQRLRESLFLKAHLAPRCRSFIRDEAPNLLVLKPMGRGTLPGYSHLTLMSPGSKVVYNMPIRTDKEEYLLYRNPSLPEPMVVDFFYNTVTELDLSIMACEGRLLLGHSGKHGRFFVCNPTQDRFIKLPAPLLNIDTRRTVAAFRYTLGSLGEMREFSVVLLSAVTGPHSYVVNCFSSGREGPGHGWVVRQWENEAVRTVVEGVSAPGVYARETGSFYWINSQTGTVIQYDPNDHLISLISPPPETEAYPIRKGWSLGSTAGRLRVSCFSVGREAEEKPYLQIHLGGLLSVWIREDEVWRSVKDIVVPVVWVLEFFRHTEFPVDAAQADLRFILVKKDTNLLLRGVEDGEIEFVSNLFVNEDPYLNRMYESFCAFFIYL